MLEHTQAIIWQKHLSIPVMVFFFFLNQSNFVGSGVIPGLTFIENAKCRNKQSRWFHLDCHLTTTNHTPFLLLDDVATTTHSFHRE